MQAAREKFGTKVALQLALRTDADQRSAERWLADKDCRAENLCALMRSDFGGDALAAIMGPDPKAWPDWYAQLRRQSSLSAARRQIVEAKRAIEKLEGAE